jgi:hypothetical protein
MNPAPPVIRTLSIITDRLKFQLYIGSKSFAER